MSSTDIILVQKLYDRCVVKCDELYPVNANTINIGNRSINKYCKLSCHKEFYKEYGKLKKVDKKI